MNEAKQIIKLLFDRHIKDFCLDEVKNGSTWMKSHLRLDFWAMKKSWSRPCVTGYEVKVSRGDWFQDEKWINYLPYCNQFYFVSPPHIIEPEEIGEQAGLLWTSKNISRLYIKKKAPFREAVIPEDIYRYILMSRVIPHRSFGTVAKPNQTDYEYWSEWLKQKRENQEIGHAASKRISEILHQKILRSEINQKQLEKSYKEVIDFLGKLGINATDPFSSWQVKQKVESLHRLVPNDFKWRLESIARDIKSALKSVAELEKEQPEQENDDFNLILLDDDEL